MWNLEVLCIFLHRCTQIQKLTLFVPSWNGVRSIINRTVVLLKLVVPNFPSLKIKHEFVCFLNDTTIPTKPKKSKPFTRNLKNFGYDLLSIILLVTLMYLKLIKLINKIKPRYVSQVSESTYKYETDNIIWRIFTDIDLFSVKLISQ